MAARGNGKVDLNLKRARTGTSNLGHEPVKKKSKAETRRNEMIDTELENTDIIPVTPPVTPSVIPSGQETPSSATASVEATPSSIIIGLGSTATALDFNSLEGGMALRVIEEMTNGEYSLKLTRVPSKNPRTEHAHAAAMLMSQGDFLRKLGEKLLSHLGMSYESEIYKNLNLRLLG